MRKIIHIDMDAFYASVEQRDDPNLRGLPVAVGGSSRRGVVLTASYEARRFGVKSAMPVFKALDLCPDLVLVRPQFQKYKDASRHIHSVFSRFTQQIEPLSLDEAYLDVTAPNPDTPPATEIAKSIRKAIKNEIQLTASAGISYNKFLAKLASDVNKPDGMFVIRPNEAQAFLRELPIARFHGVGPATAKKLMIAGVSTGADLQATGQHEAIRLLGSTGGWLWELAQGHDERPVNPERDRKSLSVETTFFDDITGLNDLADELRVLTHELFKRCHRSNFFGSTMTLKIKYQDFRIRSRSKTATSAMRNEEAFVRRALELLHSQPLEDSVRLIGIGVSQSEKRNALEQRQLDLPFKDNHTA